MSCHHSAQKTCLHKVPVFEHLTEEEAATLTTVIHSKPFKKGEFIFREGERSETLFVLNRGLVKISKMSESGKEQILRFLFPGDFLGQFALLQDKCHYANAEVLDTTEVCMIYKKDFLPLIEANSQMAYRFLLAVSSLLQQADEWIGTISLLETEKRLAKLLMTFYEKNNCEPQIKLPAQKKELAALLGTTPETLSRKLTSLEDLGIIAIQGLNITILQPDRLNNEIEA